VKRKYELDIMKERTQILMTVTVTVKVKVTTMKISIHQEEHGQIMM